MADLKISQFADGGAVQPTDEIATNRAGINTKVFVGTAAAADIGSGPGDVPSVGGLSSILGSAAFEDVGTDIGDVVQFEDDGGGNPQYPAGDGSQLTNLPNSLPDGDKGDITVSGGGTVWTVDNGLAATKIANGTVDNTEFQTLNGVTSSIQTQLDGKVATTGAQNVGGVKTFTDIPVMAAGGLKLPATQVPSADPNVLDDYEEGIFTPTWTGSTTNPVIGNGTIVGVYTKIGRLVRGRIEITAGSTTTFGSGFYGYGGLPFPMVSSSEVNGISAQALDVGVNFYPGFLTPASTTAFNIATPAGVAWNPTTPFTMGNGDKHTINFTYQSV